MNFLELVQRTRQECGIAGAATSVVNQSGEARRVIDWVRDAWLEIQGQHDDWDFLRADFTITTTPGVGEYQPSDAVLTPAGDWKKWHKDTLRLYRNALGLADEQYFVEWDYKVFRDTYRYNLQTPGRPAVFAERPQDSAIMLGPVADEVCTIVGECQRGPVSLLTDTDVPAIAPALHMVIVYKAMEYYALYESAAEVLERSRRGLANLMPQMERRYLPEVSFGDPLA